MDDAELVLLTRATSVCYDSLLTLTGLTLADALTFFIIIQVSIQSGPSRDDPCRSVGALE